MHSYEWFMSLRAYFWFAVLVHGSVAGPKNNENTLKEWIASCNCTCARQQPGIPLLQLVLQTCTTEAAFTIDRTGKLTAYNSNFSWLNETPSAGQLLCRANKNIRLHAMLLSLKCNEKRSYVIYKRSQRPLNKLKKASNSISTLSSTLSLGLLSPTFSPSLRTTDRQSPSKQKEKQQDNKQSQNRLVVGLCTGLGIMVLAVGLWAWIRCRRRRSKKKSDEAEQNPEFGYIDEEDSVPYRIVDLTTNVSCDASGYTFLAAPNQDENPYMKLQPRCKRAHKECTEDLNHSFEEVVDEDEDRPYQTLQPTESDDNKDSTEKHDFEEIVDEPVYFILETKETPKNT